MDDRTMTPGRYVTPAGATVPPREPVPHPIPPEGSWEAFRGVGDPNQRYSIWRLCLCDNCEGRGKVYPMSIRCPDCRGEGRTLELIATCGTPEAVGVALVTLGREREWSDCPLGILDAEGEKGQKWLVSPWERSPRNVSDAGRLLRQQR